MGGGEGRTSFRKNEKKRGSDGDTKGGESVVSFLRGPIGKNFQGREETMEGRRIFDFSIGILTQDTLSW